MRKVVADVHEFRSRVKKKRSSMSKVYRDTSTPAGKAFWEPSARAQEVEKWPDWRRAGINVTEPARSATPRATPTKDDSSSRKPMYRQEFEDDLELIKAKEVIFALSRAGLVKLPASADLAADPRKLLRELLDALEYAACK